MECMKCRYGAPSRIRTCDLPLRRGTLYPSELTGQCLEFIIMASSSQRFALRAVACTHRKRKVILLILYSCCFIGAGRETRTLTLFPEPDFESGASTGSATPAHS